jgi:hypothetical protein
MRWRGDFFGSAGAFFATAGTVWRDPALRGAALRVGFLDFALADLVAADRFLALGAVFFARALLFFFFLAATGNSP